MKTSVRARLALLALFFLLAGLGGCSTVMTAATSVGSSIEHVAARIIHPSPAPGPASKPVPAGLDDYKTQVAQHVLQHNPERSYSGKLPPMLPAIVVLRITVDENGGLDDVAVQRSRDDDASQIALDSMRRSSPLPPPRQLAQAGGKLTFSETFLFADSGRYQLRSLAAPQTAD
ncbi:MAG: energy transducer TonB [Telluria sp.]